MRDRLHLSGDDRARLDGFRGLNQDRAVCMRPCGDDNPTAVEGDDDEFADEFVSAVGTRIHLRFSFASWSEVESQQVGGATSARQIRYLEDAPDKKFVSFSRHF